MVEPSAKALDRNRMMPALLFAHKSKFMRAGGHFYAG
jgi:hypothetical protein